MGVIEADFGGWATKAGLKCTDGRTIMRGAFEQMHHQQVPLVWQHGHSDAKNVLGHAVLEHRDEGVYAYAFFNDTEQGRNARSLVEHGDIKYLSIYANNLVEKAKNVMHGVIREVSLVLAGANPGATIDFVNIQHGDGSVFESEEEAVIHTGIALDHANFSSEDPDEDDEDDEDEDEDLQHADEDLTVQDVYNTLDEEQRNVVHYLIGVALEDAKKSAAHSATGTTITHEGGDGMSRNVFDQNSVSKTGGSIKHALTQDDVKGIFADAVKVGSIREAVNNYALQHGIENIDTLFPDAKMATGTIDLEKRRTEWVSSVLNGTRKTPFSRIKTFTADLTQDDARAKGYIKGTYKEEEWFGVSKRTTSPTTIYKKQKLDRDDMLDITDFDIVAFLKAEMRLMTEEEVARAILVGDGRSPGDTDKVKDPLGASDGVGIRSIVNDHELFVTTLNVNVNDADSSYEEVVDAVMDGMEFYKGTGTPTLYTTVRELNKFLKAKDGMGRRYYANKSEVAQVLGVKDIQLVEPLNEHPDVIGIIVNLDDYNVGTDRGGELTMFEDFDIDYNQQKYLLETRLSGALVRPKSALVLKKTDAASVLATPEEPGFNASTGVITIPTVTGVTYTDADGTTLTAGAQPALAVGSSETIHAVANSGYHFANTAQDSWTFTRRA
ncbi:capsid maturation protease [Streptomyces phage SscP1EGY]|nr:capsid maturation protease [Streptomyces phage SscP1EGY]